MDGNIHTYKTRLVAKGFTQTYGVDYEENYSPIADIKAIRILIAISMFYDYESWQIDVKTAFLNDDILLIENNIPMLQDVKSWLGKCFAMKGLGAAAYILGTKIYRDRLRQLIGLSQNAYIDKILKWFKMDVSKHGSLSMQPNVDLSSFMYATRHVFLMNGGAVDWKSSKQSTTAMYSTEDEYIAISEAAMEAIWIHKFIYRLGVVPNNDKPMDMYCDNAGSITIVDEPRVQKGAKHFR
ncbi:retrotransposon protein, putative, ty1-copia subclass [Tanacetum coccineum]